MSNPINLLARMFRRSGAESPVVASLFTQAFGRPLLVHPNLGAQLVHAYLQGATEAPEPIVAAEDGRGHAGRQQRRVAVLNISGPLVDRPQPGLCDDGPVSYEAIRDALDASMGDDSVGAIIMRMRSPGGMVDGCFDLADHIYASRGPKPIYAVVDNIAYSGCYALAAACDEIYVSRTSGVGSIGVYTYHLDQTAYNANQGIKITLIYAGDHKVDFSPHVELSEGAKDAEQAVIDEMYGLFVSSVARYRGMDVAKVIGTQAQTYNGQAAIEVGLATRLGTMRDALAALAETDEQRSTREAAEAKAAAEADRAIAAQAVIASGAKPDVVAALLAEGAGITAASIQARLEHAQAVIDLCVAAGDRSLAGDYITTNTNIEIVRKQLLDVKATSAAEIVTALPNVQDVRPAATSAETVYSRRRAAAAGNGTTSRQ